MKIQTKNIIRIINIGAVLFAIAFISRLCHQNNVANDRKSCLITMRNIQCAVRTYFALNSVKTFTKENIIGNGEDMLREPICPSGGTYTWIEGSFPEVGTTTIRCSIKEHNPKDYSDW